MQKYILTLYNFYISEERIVSKQKIECNDFYEAYNVFEKTKIGYHDLLSLTEKNDPNNVLGFKHGEGLQ